jgi:hypothetical protein
MYFLHYVLSASMVLAAKKGWFSPCQLNADCDPHYYCGELTKFCMYQLEDDADKVEYRDPNSPTLATVPAKVVVAKIGGASETILASETADKYGFSLCSTDLDCKSGLTCNSGTCIEKAAPMPKQSIVSWVFWVILVGFLAVFLLGALAYYKKQEFREERKERKGKGVATAPSAIQNPDKKQTNIVV